VHFDGVEEGAYAGGVEAYFSDDACFGYLDKGWFGGLGDFGED
jgi:hypothetical protein